MSYNLQLIYQGKKLMKISLNIDSSSLLIQAKEISGLNFNELLKEAMTLLVLKYKDLPIKHEDQNDQNTARNKQDT